MENINLREEIIELFYDINERYPPTKLLSIEGINLFYKWVEKNHPLIFNDAYDLDALFMDEEDLTGLFVFLETLPLKYWEGLFLNIKKNILEFYEIETPLEADDIRVIDLFKLIEKVTI